MHNQHAGLSQQLAAQRITERHEQAAQARLAHSASRSRRRRHRWLTRRWWQLARRPGAAVTRALILGAMLAATHLASLTALAHAQANDQQASRRPPTQGQVGEAWHRRSATSQQDKATDATLGREQAREPFAIPDPTPAQLPVSAPTQPNRQPSWLLVSLGALAGLAVVGARRASRRARLGQPA